MKFINHSFFKSLIFNIVIVLLAVLFCDMKYEVSDDFVMQSILEGAYGSDYDPHLLFSNIILGYGLIVLYRMIPSVGWYFIMHIGLCFISLTIITFVIIDISKNYNILAKAFIWLSLVLFVGYFSDDIYILVQFTKTAAVTCFAGGILVLYAYNHFGRWKRIIGITIGTILCLLGSMVRRGSMQVSLMFLFIIFIIEAWSLLKNNSINVKLIKKIAFQIVICLCIYFSAISLVKINRYLWESDEEYKDYPHMNSVRASVTDISGGDNEVFRQTLMDNGYTLEDTYMIQSWEFIDQDYFTEESINKIADLKRNEAVKTTQSFRDIIKNLWERQYYKYIICWVIFLLLFIAIIVKTKEWIFLIITLLVCGFQLGYCVHVMRIVYRAEYCIFFCTAATLLYIITINISDSKFIEKYADMRVLKGVIHGLIMLAVILKIPFYIPDDNYKHMTNDEYNSYIASVLYESWNYDIRKYRINMSKRPPYDDIITTMENDDNNYYLCDFASTIQLLYYHYKPWESMPIGYYKDTYSYIGGVTSYFPGCYKVWAANGIDYINPYKSIANDNIRIVDNYYNLTKIRYYNEKYNPDAQLLPVDVVDGMSIWKIR